MDLVQQVTQWSGDLAGSANPETLSMDGGAIGQRILYHSTSAQGDGDRQQSSRPQQTPGVRLS